jgi:hypothetical protein
VVDFGLYKAELSREEELDSSPTGTLAVSGERHHIETTTNFPLVIGTLFGVEYIVHSEKSDRTVLRFKWIPSSPVMAESGEKITEISFERTRTTNKVHFAGYELTIDSELAPKSWTLQIFSKDVLLYEQTFYAIEN